MTRPGPSWQRLAVAGEIPARGLLFTFRDGPFSSTGILLRDDGGVRAWRNECRHLAVRLDRETEGSLFDRDGALLMCQVHGALYRPGDGVCIAGPCAGSRLCPLPVRELAGAVWLVCDELRPPLSDP